MLVEIGRVPEMTTKHYDLAPSGALATLHDFLYVVYSPGGRSANATLPGS